MWYEKANKIDFLFFTDRRYTYEYTIAESFFGIFKYNFTLFYNLTLYDIPYILFSKKVRDSKIQK